jgi:hypothetical protein
MPTVPLIDLDSRSPDALKAKHWGGRSNLNHSIESKRWIIRQCQNVEDPRFGSVMTELDIEEVSREAWEIL